MREIHHTPAVKTDPNGPIFVSQLAAVYLDMYLIAVKSAAYWIRPREVYVLNDGSLKAGHIGLLKKHIPDLRIISIGDVDVGACPRGGTWERLNFCIAKSADAFVIQIDSDTVTVQNPAEVIECIAKNSSFTMSGCVSGDPNDPSLALLTPLEARSLRADEFSKGDSPHIQVLAETTLPSLRVAEAARYIRGCSGFAGYGRGKSSLEDLREFSKEMQQLVGERWNEWGTEQVASNFIVANSPGGTLLPWPAYAGQIPGLPDAARMIHFTGEHRFDFGTYRAATSRIVELLGSS